MRTDSNSDNGGIILSHINDSFTTDMPPVKRLSPQGAPAADLRNVLTKAKITKDDKNQP